MIWLKYEYDRLQAEQWVANILTKTWMILDFQPQVWLQNMCLTGGVGVGADVSYQDANKYNHRTTEDEYYYLTNCELV